MEENMKFSSEILDPNDCSSANGMALSTGQPASSNQPDNHPVYLNDISSTEVEFQLSERNASASFFEDVSPTQRIRNMTNDEKNPIEGFSINISTLKEVLSHPDEAESNDGVRNPLTALKPEAQVEKLGEIGELGDGFNASTTFVPSNCSMAERGKNCQESHHSKFSSNYTTAPVKLGNPCGQAENYIGSQGNVDFNNLGVGDSIGNMTSYENNNGEAKIGGDSPEARVVWQPTPQKRGMAEASNVRVSDEIIGGVNDSEQAAGGSPPDITRSHVCVNAQVLSDAMKKLDSNFVLDLELTEFLSYVVNSFLESVARGARNLAKHRNSDIVQLQDLQLHMKRDWQSIIKSSPPSLRDAGSAISSPLPRSPAESNHEHALSDMIRLHAMSLRSSIIHLFDEQSRSTTDKAKSLTRHRVRSSSVQKKPLQDLSNGTALAVGGEGDLTKSLPSHYLYPKEVFSRPEDGKVNGSNDADGVATARAFMMNDTVNTSFPQSNPENTA